MCNSADSETKGNQMSEVTICVKCHYHQVKDPPKGHRGPYDSTWSHLCTASPLPRKIDFVTGREVYCGTNDLGTEYHSDQVYKYCRDVNNGKCSKFRFTVGETA